MKCLQWLAFCAAGAMILSACGSDPKSPNTGTNITNPNPSPATPTPTPKPAPAPTTGNGLKWTSTELTTQSQSCASRGGSDITYDTWLAFCTCAYTEAAKKWSYTEFYDDFENNYDTLYANGAIQSCLDKAGIGGNN